MQQLKVECSIWTPAPHKQVWEAVTTPEQIRQWFVPNLPFAEMKQDENGKLSVYMGEMGIDFAILEGVDSLWQVNLQTLPDKLITVSYNLSKENEGTTVTVTMNGFELLLEDARQDRLIISRESWEKTLANLKAYITGTELPFPQAYVGPLFGYWREAKNTLTVERSIWIAASLERVWHAITAPKELQHWFSPSTVWELTALEVGGRYYVHNAETNTEMYVEIIEDMNPPHKITTRCIPEPPGTADKFKTYVLQEENSGTRLTIVYSGYELEAEDMRWSNMEQTTFGFGMMLQNTKAFIEGKSLPYPQGF
jgi:uncharacterized protein YndB with AHSA1/START domain